jgi:hypothetical protein
MPNTLAHFGVQGAVTRLVVRDADPKWVFAGCLLPDVPWILRRGVTALVPAVDPIDLRLYCMGQASLAGCLLLSGALAALSRRPRLVFSVLSLNVLMHLLLDACQTKWGNGVHLFAPFDWTLWNFGLFWPEAWPTSLLTISGLVWFAWVWRRRDGVPVPLAAAPRHLATFAALLAAYLALPLAFTGGAEAVDAHSSATLRHPARGARLEVDRGDILEDGTLSTWARRDFRVTGVEIDGPAEVSLKGTLTGPESLEVTDHHMHAGRLRDFPTFLGLLLLALIWVFRYRDTQLRPARLAR